MTIKGTQDFDPVIAKNTLDTMTLFKRFSLFSNVINNTFREFKLP